MSDGRIEWRVGHAVIDWRPRYVVTFIGTEADERRMIKALYQATSFLSVLIVPIGTILGAIGGLLVHALIKAILT